MRDIALTLIILGMLPFVFKQPVLGAYMWAWLSLMNPHKLTFGFAYSMPWAQLIAIVTLIAFVATRKKQGIPMNAITGLWLALLVWMSFTSLFALHRPEIVFDRWVFVMKIHFMLLITLMLVTEPKQLRVLVWVVTLSVAFYGVKGGIYTITTGGGGRVWGPPGGLLKGNNELAVGLVMLTPFLYWLRQTTTHKWARRLMTVSIALCLLSILGSQSRGAFLAVMAMGVFLGIKSAHPVRMTMLMVAVLAVAVSFMPDSWTQRMDTIEEYQEDGSAMSRIYTWTTLWNAAVDRPVVGAGFRADSGKVFDTYAPTGGKWERFRGRIWVAHSIYFQMLGEHGFVGLALFLAFWTVVWFSAGKVARRARGHPTLGGDIPLLMRMTQVSLIGYAVGGAFLSLAYLDLPYYAMGYVVLCGIFVRRPLPMGQTAPASGVAVGPATAQAAVPHTVTRGPR